MHDPWNFQLNFVSNGQTSSYPGLIVTELSENLPPRTFNLDTPIYFFFSFCLFLKITASHHKGFLKFFFKSYVYICSFLINGFMFIKVINMPLPRTGTEHTPILWVDSYKMTLHYPNHGFHWWFPLPNKTSLVYKLMLIRMNLEAKFCMLHAI